MPTIRAIAVSVFGLALLAVSAAENSTGSWTTVKATDADSKLLYAAWGNVSNFGPGITTYGCGYNVLDLQKKGAAAEGSKAGNIYDFKLQSVIDYHFTVQGCGLEGDEQQYFGYCEDIDCLITTFDVYITSEPKTNTLRVTSVSARAEEDTGGEGKGLGGLAVLLSTWLTIKVPSEKVEGKRRYSRAVAR
ncbi:hypothetical protein PHYSODRAFT_480608 [Phytophthora sojae]|uniref:Uncharacterized protein n=1 Tax=Phytophthora sojae (strain P6497) TaxID=1094619 RepID=G4YZY4_PHYSP|nr:hypothetical protein PHYSODRAFT_480608 [Phytophthora sojae]EGZ23347.1 hypothetical protein PHYSODRAFT_480608 [Phytophthora sojae]|eukprot:XP_009518635.1 hypothetical protein PHYSODRAFT_480608 [Phytophthora sojae]